MYLSESYICSPSQEENAYCSYIHRLNYPIHVIKGGSYIYELILQAFIL